MTAVALQVLVWGLWPALAGAALAGLAAGLLSCSTRRMGAGGWVALGLALALVVAGMTVAWLGWLPGRDGLRLEIALLLAPPYGVGSLLGCFARRLWRRIAGSREDADTAALP